MRVQVLTELYLSWEGGQGNCEPAPRAGSAACRLSWGERRNPTASCTEGETEANSTCQVGLAWESAILSRLPAGRASLDSVSPSGGGWVYLTQSLGAIILKTNKPSNNLHGSSKQHRARHCPREHAPV